MLFAVRVKFRTTKVDAVTGKVKQITKTGPVFSVEATSKANAQPLIKDALVKRGIKNFSIVPAADGQTYLVYAQG